MNEINGANDHIGALKEHCTNDAKTKKVMDFWRDMRQQQDVMEGKRGSKKKFSAFMLHIASIIYALRPAVYRKVIHFQFDDYIFLQKKFYPFCVI